MVLRASFTLLLCIAVPFLVHAQEKVLFEESWGDPGFNLVSQTRSGVEIVFSVPHIDLLDFNAEGLIQKKVLLPGAMLGNDEGAPDLPGISRFIAVPEGSDAIVEILDIRMHVIEDIDVLPAPAIPLDNDDSPPVYERNPAIYGADTPYPAEPVSISEPLQMRGVDTVIVGVTPFAYHPVERELTVYTDLEIRITFSGGSNRFGEDNLRSRWFEPMLKQHLLNYDSLEKIYFDNPPMDSPKAFEECEYMIFIPDDPIFQNYAEMIRDFRIKQGISTRIFNLGDVGATAVEIEAKIDDAYRNWTTKPVAVLLMGDSDYMPASTWANNCLSDNMYADVDGDSLPELNVTRLTAQNPIDLDRMVNKVINYETDPPTNPDFYNHPVIAGGWQESRWFIICTEICGGFLSNVKGKSPVREYSIYYGVPGSNWSTNQNTYMLIDYFGPSPGLGYIPATCSHLTDWGGNATRINNDLNSGAFYMMHRDHGREEGWPDPDYEISDLVNLDNDDLCFVLSINCLTGKYDHATDCFAEAFLKLAKGALGVIAASESSYSFVNDTFVFGLHDALWPDFDPGYGGTSGDNAMMPGFAHASGKWFLEGSSWPYNPDNKEITYHLFHMHGDAFTTIYSEIPQNLTVSHASVMNNTDGAFTVTADVGSLIGLSMDGKVLGAAIGTGAPLSIPIKPPGEAGTMYVTVTKANHYRYESPVTVTIGGPIAMSTIDGPPTSTLPGPATDVTVMIAGGSENYVQGSGEIYYRFSPNDAYESALLIHLESNLYNGQVPGAGPDSLPEFYFKAEGDLGSTVYCPPDAPVSTYSMTMDGLVEILMEDNFETNTGWTVQNQSIETGAWERADPEGTSAQPEDDHSPEGVNCFITGPLAGEWSSDYDVDGGPTQLISPLIDLSTGDAEISFYLYFHHSFFGTQQPLEIEISNNGGESWRTVYTVIDEPVWALHSFDVSDHIVPTSQIQLRFSAIDNPDDSVVEAGLDDFKVSRTVMDATLWASAYSISVAEGAMVDLTLDAGTGYANRNFMLLGSVTGTYPGFTLPGGLRLPLNWDIFTDIVLQLLGTPVCQNFLGLLDADGRAIATLNSYGPLDPSTTGIGVNFAYLLGKPFDFVSNPIAIEIVP